MRVRLLAVTVVLVSFFPLMAAWNVRRIDLLSSLGLTVNAAGPLLVGSDAQRRRVFLAYTQTSSLSIIDADRETVVNVPLPGRLAHYLKNEALAVSSSSGRVYLAGPRALFVVDPQASSSRSFPLDAAYESLAVDEETGNAFLVGRASRRLAMVNVASGKVSYTPWAGSEEAMTNLNATPPPPVRKVICDNRRVFAFDGGVGELTEFDARNGRRLNHRSLSVAPAPRWHLAGCSRRRHCLYLVAETGARQATQALAVDLAGSRDRIVPLPGLTEAVGIAYSETRDEAYIAYDNHPTLQVVDFAGQTVSEIRLPSYGNDALALDEAGGRLFVASWAWSEVEVIDLAARRLACRFTRLGILPHMFGMAFMPGVSRLYIPLGATAVNGSFGSALTVLDPKDGSRHKIVTGWAPVDLQLRSGHDTCLAFSAEGEMAEMHPDGRFTVTPLPIPYPRASARDDQGNIYLAYGAHQSFWPAAYIWGARNGVLTLRCSDLALDDRPLPRLAQRLVCAGGGALYALQNNWGEEKAFLAALPDPVRSPNLPDLRLELDDKVVRETGQRLLAWDPGRDWLYVVRLGETDTGRGVLQVIERATGKTLKRLDTGVTPSDLAFDERFIYVANFDSGSVSRFDKNDFSIVDLPAGKEPLKLALTGGRLYAIDHAGATLHDLTGRRAWKIPAPGRPDNLAVRSGRLWLTVHAADQLTIMQFDPNSGRFTILHQARYPYGDTAFDTGNASFYTRGQFADGLFDISVIRFDEKERVWISDFLSGAVFVLGEA
jgi:DNA-binding beta-propeller fold protein YncE